MMTETYGKGFKSPTYKEMVMHNGIGITEFNLTELVVAHSSLPRTKA